MIIRSNYKPRQKKKVWVNWEDATRNVNVDPSTNFIKYIVQI